MKVKGGSLMRRRSGRGSIVCMRWTKRRKRRARSRGAGLELAAGLLAASQMALLYPPGCDEWIRRELAGKGEYGQQRSPAEARANAR